MTTYIYGKVTFLFLLSTLFASAGFSRSLDSPQIQLRVPNRMVSVRMGAGADGGGLGQQRFRVRKETCAQAGPLGLLRN